jgi:hypothetical protein
MYSPKAYTTFNEAECPIYRQFIGLMAANGSVLVSCPTARKY